MKYWKSRCVWFGPAVLLIMIVSFVLRGQGMFVVWPSIFQNDREVPSPIHIILAVDSNAYTQLPVVINSVLTRSTHDVKFHVAVCNITAEVFSSYLGCFSFPTHPDIEVVEVGRDMYRKFERYMEVAQGTGFERVANCGNYVRFLFPRIFPYLERGIYIDHDIVVNKDLFDTWKDVTSQNKILAVEHAGTFEDKKWAYLEKAMAMYSVRHKTSFNKQDTPFNAGFLYIHLDKWRAEAGTIEEEIKFWIDMHVRQRLWKVGSQPLMWMVFHNQTYHLDKTVQLRRLGAKKHLNTSESVLDDKLRKAVVLHWSGKDKPWKANSRNP